MLGKKFVLVGSAFDREVGKTAVVIEIDDEDDELPFLVETDSGYRSWINPNDDDDRWYAKLVDDNDDDPFNHLLYTFTSPTSKRTLEVRLPFGKQQKQVELVVNVTTEEGRYFNLALTDVDDLVTVLQFAKMEQEKRSGEGDDLVTVTPVNVGRG